MKKPNFPKFVFRTTLSTSLHLHVAAVVATALYWAPVVTAAEQPVVPSSISQTATSGKIDAYVARPGRTRPVVAIIGENSGTELTDFVIPYGVLMQSGVAEVITVATQPGLMQMSPSLRIQPQATVDEFDARVPSGADYVIVPAVVKRDDPTLLAWVAAQGAKGATIVSICDGALVVANTGLMKGHRGTAHWATQGMRKEMYPDTQWVSNVRYVADGKIVSSAGITAAIPTSLALVEAIAGYDKTLAVAGELGVTEWTPQHNSDVFQPKLGVNILAHLTRFTNNWFYSAENIGVPVAAGVDEIALALTVDGYSRTSRSRAYALAASSEPVQTRHGLTVVPDRVVGGAQLLDRVLPEFDATPSLQVFDKVLADVSDRYGKSTAYRVALDFEYPGYKK